ncbi:ATP-binding protein [Kitasatospora sp. NBC_01539]|uniref:ATP-binding protein n=1 Tax=Kitasatospora sp. NBC_01539 TaxID=2903577 RepID=UPI003860126C
MGNGDWLSDRARDAEGAAGGGFDLTECVREPIHLLGGVQSFGVLLAVDRVTGLIDTVSGNTADLLGVAPDDLLGRAAADLLGADVLAEAADLAAEAGDAAVLLPGRVRPGPRPDPASGPGPAPAPGSGSSGGAPAGSFEATVHLRDGLLVLELEPAADAAPPDPAFHRRIQQSLVRIRRAATVGECCAAAVREVRALTGYERVVAYRFEDADGPGEVVAEDIADGFEPWLGLWFPASDIPPQARRLYRRNWIRVIGDVDDRTVGLHPPTRPSTGAPLDLSSAALRTVSEFHLEYLRNIRVRSSMSVSVLCDDELWGLIACHGSEPRWLSPDVRTACELFGAALSVQLAALADRERVAALDRSRTAITELLGEPSDPHPGTLRGRIDGLLALVEADGVVVSHEGGTTTAGQDVPAGFTERLHALAGSLRPGELWATDRLAEADGPDAEPAPGTPAGVLLLPFAGEGSLIAWHRGEWPVTRRWAADPALPVRLGQHGERLTPRGSSAVFRATVRGRSRPWTDVDTATARAVSRTVSGLMLRHAAWTAELNRRLARSNADLDAFAHAAAHDLKEPLRGISNAASFIMEDAAGALDAVSRRRLHTVQRLAARMNGLLDSLLHYSQVGTGGLSRGPVPLEDSLREALEIAGERLAEQGVSVLRGRLPVLSADPDRLQEVLVNLLVNAAKYAGEQVPRTVFVGVEERIPPEGGGPLETVVVRDNGIGVPEDQQDEVFGLFRRLHRRDERGGGSGAGLAIVRRIVERHGGRIWLESPPSGGTSVCFTLQEGDGAPSDPAPADVPDVPGNPDAPGDPDAPVGPGA